MKDSGGLETGNLPRPQVDLKRREVLKLAAIPWLLKLEKFLPHEAPRERINWSETRFFENVEDFEPEKFMPQIERELGLIPYQFKDQLALISFDEEKWQSNTEKSMSQLKRLKQVYLDLKNEGNLSPRAKTMIEDDFYEVGSAVWALLMVREEYWNVPEKFEEALRNPSITNVYDTRDPFLGEEIFSINAQWADVWSVSEDRYGDDNSALATIGAIRQQSPLYRLLDQGTLLNYLKVKSLSQRKIIKFREGPIAPKRPKEANIYVATEDEELKEEIKQILKEYRLERAASNLGVFEGGDNPWGEYDDFLNQIVLGIGEANIESFRKFPTVWKEYVLHEFGHSLHKKIVFLEKDVDVVKYTVALEEMLELFRPTRNLKTFFTPSGKFASLDLSNESIIEFLERTDKDINEAGITDYPATEFVFPDNDVNEKSLFFKLTYFLYRLYGASSKYYSQPLDDLMIYRLFAKGESDTPIASIEDFYQNEYKQYLDQSGYRLNEFEKRMLDTIENNLELFKAPERRMFKIEPAGVYFNRVILPFVITKMVEDNPEEVEGLITSYYPSEDRQKVRHIFSLLRKKDIEFSELQSQEELFAEVFQASLRRHDPGVTNEIDEEVWQQVDKTVNYLLNKLIREGLALRKRTDISV